MNRHQYTVMRTNGQFDTNLLYNHFVTKGGNLPSNIFTLAIQMLPELPGIMLESLDQEFNVTRLEDSMGRTIKVY